MLAVSRSGRSTSPADLAVHHRVRRRRDRLRRQLAELDRARGTSTVPVTRTVGQRDLDVEIGRHEDLRVGQLHRLNARAGELELRGPAARGLERRRARELELALAGLAGRVERERAAVGARRGGLDSVDDEAPLRHRDAALGSTRARPSTVGASTVPPMLKVPSSEPATWPSSGDSSARKPRSGHCTATLP